MQKAIERFCETKNHGLFLVDMPTGAGKTYLTMKLIGGYIRGEILSDVKTIFYLTPLRKNVDDTYKDLLKEFKNDRELFDSTVLRIYANYECVLENFQEVESEIKKSDLRSKDSYKNLAKKIQTYKVLSASNIDKVTLDGFLMEIRRFDEPAFRKDVAEMIAKKASALRERKKLLNKEFAWIKKLYPACLTDERKVIIMTMDKFISGNDPIISKPYRFISNSKTNDALIFIDEFDTTKDVVLNHEIDRCSDFKIDLIKLFASIANSLKGREFPTAIFANSVDENDEKSSLSSFNKMKNVILEVERDHNLNYLYKLETDKPGDRCFLFYFYKIHTIASAEGNRIKVSNDKKKKQNTITIVKENDDGKFYRAVYDMKGALNYFLNCCAMLSRNYYKYYNSLAKEAKGDFIEIDQAVSTIIDPFNLDSNLEKTIVSMVVDNVAISIAERKDNTFSTDFYLDGFRYFDFHDDISHNASTAIVMCDMDNTPEKFMLSLSSKARVVGLSATGKIETVTGNYNIEYLEEKLDADFFTLNEEEKIRISNYVNDRLKGSSNIRVTSESVMCSEEGKIDDIVRQLFTDDINVEKFIGTFTKYSDDKSEKPLFQIIRFVKSMLAVKDFLCTSCSRVLLVITNRNIRVGDDNHIFSLSIVEKVISAISKELHVAEPKIHYLQGADFAEQKAKYLADVNTDSKIVVFTSYNTAGTGQNLQYEDDSDLKDIDSIYVEEPRNILVNCREDVDEKSLLKYIYQMESLQVTGEIAGRMADQEIRNAFTKYMVPYKSIKSDEMSSGRTPYKTISVNNHKVKVLIQAIGRICRTNNKNSSINIFVDDDILQSIDFSVALEDGRLLNPEFKEIVKLSRKEPVVQDNYINLTKAANRNRNVEVRINSLLSENKEIWKEKDKILWETVRDIVLKHPTISKDKLKDLIIETGISSLRDIYLYAKDGEKINSYYFNKDDVLILYDYGKKVNNAFLIDAYNSRLGLLTKIPEVKAYFIEHDYALEFKKDEAIILPVVYQNIYKGALGEAAGKAILRQYGIEIESICDLSKYEKFDFCLKANKDVYVDFKNWSDEDRESAAKYIEKSYNKLKRIGGRKAFIINIFANEFQVHESGGGIIEVSTLVDIANKNQGYRLKNHDRKRLLDKIWSAINGDNE